MDDFNSNSNGGEKETERKFQTITHNENNEQNLKKDGLFNFGINSLQFYRKKNQPKHKSSYSIDFNSTTKSTTISNDVTRTEFSTNVRSTQPSPNKEKSFFSSDCFSTSKETVNTSRAGETNRSNYLSKSSLFKGEVKSTNDRKFRREMEEFSKNLTSQEGKSYINKPMVNFQSPNLNLSSKNYFTMSPTQTRFRTKITSNLDFSRDISYSSNNITSYGTNCFKVSYAKNTGRSNYFDKVVEKKTDEIENFFNDFKIINKKNSKLDGCRK